MLSFVTSPKVKMINVRLTPLVHDEFKIACDLRGASMSSLMHQFVVRTIREEKVISPQSFKSERKVNGNILRSAGVNGRELAPYSKGKMLMQKTVRIKQKKKAG